jgi:hypothetical protein
MHYKSSEINHLNVYSASQVSGECKMLCLQYKRNILIGIAPNLMQMGLI